MLDISGLILYRSAIPQADTMKMTYLFPDRTALVRYTLAAGLLLAAGCVIAGSARTNWFKPTGAPPASPGREAILKLGGGVTMALVWIDPGAYKIGSAPDEPGRRTNERQPQSVVIARGFWMGKAEVTQQQYQRVMGKNPSYFDQAGSDAPVEGVSWTEASLFCQKIQQLSGFSVFRIEGANQPRCRLPKETEWEYACRAGARTPLYTGTLTIKGENNSPELDAIAWYGGNSGVNYGGAFASINWPEKHYNHTRAGTHPVMQKQPNAWGLYDMLGNVAEWCEADYPDQLTASPVAPRTTSSQIIRGGSWNSAAQHCRCAQRNELDPNSRHVYFGFRIVVQ